MEEYKKISVKKKEKLLISQWLHIAKSKFFQAKYEKDPMWKRLIEHGAICYFNCAQELKKVLSSSSSLLLVTQKQSLRKERRRT